MAYKFELPKELQGIHNTYHVSNLKKCLSDESLIISFDEIKLDDKLHFIEKPVEIMDREESSLSSVTSPLSRFIGIPNEDLSSHGNVRIESRACTLTSSRVNQEWIRKIEHRDDASLRREGCKISCFQGQC
ncbi:hypothetical protein Tco_0310154 [Tanacetum coccineum]